MEEPISFDWCGYTLLGIHHRVSNPDAPGLLYIHGMPGDRVDARRLPVRLSRSLQKLHFASLRIDLYASGVSDGVFHKLSYKSELSQILFLIDAIRKRALWRGPIVLLGFSEAGKLAISAARQHTDVAGICLWNGIITHELLPDDQRVRRLRRVDGQMVFDNNYGLWVNKAIIQEAQELSIAHSRMLPDIPILGVYGSSDPFTPASSALLNQAGHDVVFIDGADHLFTTTDWEASLMATTETWLHQQFASL